MKISRWWHLVSLTVFLVVGIALPIIIIHQAISLFSTSEFFFVPGSVELKLTPGKYVIWNVSKEFYKGTQYEFPDTLPAGMHIQIVEASSGKEIPCDSTMACSEGDENTNMKRRAICSFATSGAGTHIIKVTGSSEKRLLMVRRSIFLEILGRFAMAAIVFFAGCVMPPIISIVIEILRYCVKKAMEKSIASA